MFVDVDGLSNCTFFLVCLLLDLTSYIRIHTRSMDGSIHAFAVGAEYCPFIVSLYDAYKYQNQLRLVMEYMNGGSLQVGRWAGI